MAFLEAIALLAQLARSLIESLGSKVDPETASHLAARSLGMLMAALEAELPHSGQEFLQVNGCRRVPVVNYPEALSKHPSCREMSVREARSESSSFLSI